MNQTTSIQIERTQEFLEAAKRLSDFISSLPLNKEQNDRLVHEMIEQIQLAERSAFMQGFEIGLEWKGGDP